ncbi:MAG: Uma2 family endonuclease [Deltaproteobacteria bacterium]|nr:Uma2 family endonuclease [Deltaproteobacteria bacterium]
MATQVEHVSEATPGASPSGRVILHGVPWERYDALVQLLGDEYPGLRLTYLEGTLEIMTTSPEHERWKKTIARLIEMWAIERDVKLNGYGAATFRNRAKERGLEPDECYVLGELVDVPDVAIEVVRTHGGIDKLEVYAGLGVPEVWFWEDGSLVVYRLAGQTYERQERSSILPELDLPQLASFVTIPDQTDAVRAYRDALRRTSGL